MRTADFALHKVVAPASANRPILLVVSPDPTADCLRLAVTLPRYLVRSVDDYHELGGRSAGESSPVVMVINGTSSAADTSAQVILGLVAEARHQFPESPIVLLNGAQDASRRALLRLSCLGVAALMFEGIDDRAGVADAVLANARAIHLSQRLRAALRGEAPPWLIDIWANAVARGYERTRVPDLARASGLGIRGFTKRLGKLSGLVPSRMIRIAEMLCAIDAIEAGPWNVIEVVRLLGYKQRRTLERITGEVIGCTPWETRHQGGVTHALACVRMLVKVNRVALQE